MIEINEMVAMPQLRIVIKSMYVSYCTRGNPMGLENGFNFMHIAVLGPGCDDRIERILCRNTIRWRPKTGIVLEIRLPHHLAKLLPLVIRLDDERHPLVFSSCWVDTMRRKLCISISNAFLNAIIYRVVEEGRGKKMKRGLNLRLVNVLSLTGTTSVA